MIFKSLLALITATAFSFVGYAQTTDKNPFEKMTFTVNGASNYSACPGDPLYFEIENVEVAPEGYQNRYDWYTSPDNATWNSIGSYITLSCSMPMPDNTFYIKVKASQVSLTPGPPVPAQNEKEVSKEIPLSSNCAVRLSHLTSTGDHFLGTDFNPEEGVTTPTPTIPDQVVDFFDENDIMLISHNYNYNVTTDLSSQFGPYAPSLDEGGNNNYYYEYTEKTQGNAPFEYRFKCSTYAGKHYRFTMRFYLLKNSDNCGGNAQIKLETAHGNQITDRATLDIYNDKTGAKMKTLDITQTFGSTMLGIGGAEYSNKLLRAEITYYGYFPNDKYDPTKGTYNGLEYFTLRPLFQQFDGCFSLAIDYVSVEPMSVSVAQRSECMGSPILVNAEGFPKNAEYVWTKYTDATYTTVENWKPNEITYTLDGYGQKEKASIMMLEPGIFYYRVSDGTNTSDFSLIGNDCGNAVCPNITGKSKLDVTGFPYSQEYVLDNESALDWMGTNGTDYAYQWSIVAPDGSTSDVTKIYLDENLGATKATIRIEDGAKMDGSFTSDEKYKLELSAYRISNGIKETNAVCTKEMPIELNEILLIENVADLQTLRDGINTGEAFTYKGFDVPAGGAGKNFKLAADLDLSNVCSATKGSWTPIGMYASPSGGTKQPFKGNFDGDGHTISNLYINAPQDYRVGLFGYIQIATIKNLKLVGTDVTGKQYVGGVCGNATESIISDCTNSGSVSGTVGHVGGVCGMPSSLSTISHCANSGSVNGTGDYVGGVCGYIYNTKIENCTNSSSVSGESRVGGVRGFNYYNSRIEYCTNYGSISGETNVGGVCGSVTDNSKTEQSVNNGSVSGTEYVGGVCGNNNSGSTIAHCYYDKQMCPVTNGIGDPAESTDAEGKLTAELTNNNLFFGIGEWVVAAGMYPMPAGFLNNDLAIVAATPLFLANEETANAVATNFTVSTDNGVTWSSKNPQRATISNNQVTLVGKGKVTLVATKGNATKEVTIVSIKGTEIGTEQNPCTIDNEDDLVAFRDAVDGLNSVTAYKGVNLTNGGEGKLFKLTADLDLSNVCNATNGSWTPIGTYVNYSNNKPFKGKFDGNSHTISNLYINSTDSYQGLFGYISGATIKNVQLVGTDVTGNNYVGGVCGIAKENSTISYCTNSGSVSGTGDYIYVSGVCGEANSSTISHCTNSSNVSGTSGTNYAGGVCGNANYISTISYCANSGSISGTGTAGGICANSIYQSNINYCTNSGIINGSSNVGGVCGYTHDKSNINYSSNSGSVSGTGDESNVGGICGYKYYNCIINACYFDKQMCPDVNGVGISAEELGTEGKLTKDMAGETLRTNTTGEGWTDENWKFFEGMYPIPAGLENSEAVLAAATPIFLANDETANAVASNFTVGTGNNVAWSADNTERIVSINDSKATLGKNGEVTLTLTKGTATKSIKLTLKQKAIVADISAPASSVHGDNLALTAPAITDFGTTTTGS